ncbi:hypothetical protein K466DRAFT_656810 [Polyporus arcularius HHB13444]|uniref:F-box domain-containing protein n=1 Tax=Polyporus arcularius HHB13444 TaxID=1314778 RepID=A0A5C3NSK1_9APHY|nr:hypothetical protein K466DRAFT_656810 [Polyporus arcularius HHB13444]
MRPGKRKRWRYLRALVFDGGHISSVVAAELARVIPRATKLERLTFERAEATLGAHPDLALAFASLPNVKHVRLEKAYQHTCRMLEAMHWPLESISLNKTSYARTWKDTDKLERLHPARLLQNSRATLKFIKCQSWTECNDVLPTYPVYPEVDTLIVEGVWCPRTAQWAKCYPNLKRLVVGTIEDHFMETDEGSLLEYADARRRNIEEHAHAEETAVWTTIESFRGGPLDLYLLGLPCRIQSISLSICEESFRFFHEAMEVALPTHLSLHVSHSLLCGGATALPSSLRCPGMQKLDHLSLSFSFAIPDHDYESIESILEKTLIAISEFSLRELSLSMDYHKFPYYAESDDDGPPPSEPAPDPIELWFKKYDSKAIAQQLFHGVSSLERVNLSVGPPPTMHAYLRKTGGIVASSHVVCPEDEFRLDPFLFKMHHPFGL